MRRPAAIGTLLLIMITGCHDAVTQPDIVSAAGTWSVNVVSTGPPPAGCVIVSAEPIGIPTIGGLVELAASGHPIVVDEGPSGFAMQAIDYTEGDVAHHWTLDGVVSAGRIEATLRHEIHVQLDILTFVSYATEALSGNGMGSETFLVAGNGVHLPPDPLLPGIDQCTAAPTATYGITIR